MVSSSLLFLLGKSNEATQSPIIFSNAVMTVLSLVESVLKKKGFTYFHVHSVNQKIIFKRFFSLRVVL